MKKAVAEDRNRWSDSMEKVKSVANQTTLTGGVAAGAAMTLLGQSHPEAQRLIGTIVAPKR